MRAFIFAAILILWAVPAQAQGWDMPSTPDRMKRDRGGYSPPGGDGFRPDGGGHGGRQPGEAAPQAAPRPTASVNLSRRGRFGVEEPVEPQFPPVKFLVPPPPATLLERVENIVQGLQTPQAPEHDHYGYEIKRYMSGIGNVETMKDKKRLKQELENIGKANIILKYWNQALREEMAAIEKQIEAEDATGLIRSSFTYNQSVSLTVLAELQNWLDNNKKLLEFLEKKEGFYKVEYPNLMFDLFEDRARFGALLEAREKSLANIRRYTPWAMMIY